MIKKTKYEASILVSKAAKDSQRLLDLQSSIYHQIELALSLCTNVNFKQYYLCEQYYLYTWRRRDKCHWNVIIHVLKRGPYP